uniref:Uncharacterized protein n=1 Tax=Setaria italica TaxID=4555 RepID=K3ZPE1_SETIT
MRYLFPLIVLWSSCNDFSRYFSLVWQMLLAMVLTSKSSDTQHHLRSSKCFSIAGSL